MSLRRPAAFLVLCSIPLAACREPPIESAPSAEEPLAPLFVDRRPDAVPRTIGEDITELVRTQNEKGKEPGLPTRKGQLSPTRGPRTVQTEKGFVARLPGAHQVHSPAYHAGKVIAAAFGTYTLHAFEAESGRSAWSVRLSDDGPTDPACEDGICVFNTYSCTLFAVEAETGRHLWSWYLGSPQLATPVLANGIVYSSYPLGGGPSGAPFVIGAFDFRTGRPLWRRWIDAEVNSTPVIDGGRLWIATKLGTLYEFGAREGEVISAARNRIASPPVLTADGVVFARDHVPGTNEMLVTSQKLFPELETAKAPSGPVTPRPRPLIAAHRLLTVERDVVVAVNRRTGRRLWQKSFEGEAPANISAPILYAGEDVLLATKNGNVLRLSADTGEVTDRFELGQGSIASQPIAVDGWLYAGTTNGTLVAHDTGQRELTGWEMLGGGPARQGARDPEGT